MKKVLCFDLDNVICATRGNNYQRSKPKKKAIKLINQLYNEGHTIKIFTARFMGRNNDNIQKAKIKGYKFTLKQLEKWKLNYHKLIFGKPSFDIYIDDKSLFFKENWLNALKK